MFYNLSSKASSTTAQNYAVSHFLKIWSYNNNLFASQTARKSRDSDVKIT